MDVFQLYIYSLEGLGWAGLATAASISDLFCSKVQVLRQYESPKDRLLLLSLQLEAQRFCVSHMSG